MAIERYKVLGCKITGNRDGQGEDKGIPVGGERLTRITDITDTRHIGGEDGHTNDPPRDRMSCRGELIGRASLLEERTTEDHHAQCEDDKDDKIYQMHSFPSLIGKAANA